MNDRVLPAFGWGFAAALLQVLLGVALLPAARQRLLPALAGIFAGGAATALGLAMLPLPLTVAALLIVIGLRQRYLTQRRAGRSGPEQLRRLTPGLIAFVRIALSSHEAPAALLTRYAAQAIGARRPMQQLVSRALALSEQHQLRPFTALAATARQTGCRELIDAADALAQAEAQGHAVEQVLQAQQQTLEYLLQSEFRRLIRRRSVYLLLLTALSLIGGILVNVLYVMTEGGRLFTTLGLT